MLSKEELVSQLNKDFQHLTDRERLILTLFYFEDLTEEEIGYVTGEHLHTVQLDLAQAKTKMRGYTTIFDDIDELGKKSMRLINQ